MEREKIKLSNQQWNDLVWELYLEVDGKEVPVKEIEREYNDSHRHTEHHSLIFQRESDNKFFKVNYETSVKDSIGWSECNIDDTEAVEVFPETITQTIYN